jgi:hypothetical protein
MGGNSGRGDVERQIDREVLLSDDPPKVKTSKGKRKLEVLFSDR